MSRRPDIVVPEGLPPELRQVIVALAQRLAALEQDAATKRELAKAGVLRIQADGTLVAQVRPADAVNRTR